MIFRVFLKKAAIAAAVVAMMGGAPYAAAWAQDGFDTQRQQSAKQPQKSAGAVVRDAVMKNWSMAGEAPSPPRVRIRFNLHRDGSLNGNPVVETVSDDPRFPVFAASARRAILKALPFDLSAYSESYEDWKEVVITFDASEMESAL